MSEFSTKKSPENASEKCDECITFPIKSLWFQSYNVFTVMSDADDATNQPDTDDITNQLSEVDIEMTPQPKHRELPRIIDLTVFMNPQMRKQSLVPVS